MASAKKIQKAAYDAHVRGQQALDKGDVATAFAEDDKSADLALAAMLARMRERS